MKTLLIVFHSLTGGTRQMVEAAARGAEAQLDVRVRLLPAVEAQPADVLAADGYVFATPESLAAISGLMKDFFDSYVLPRAGAHQWSPVCDPDLCRQRRPERSASD
jgi:multimeric flavodoxin WrbA